MSHHPRLAYVLLAAGASKRFGSCKQLATLDFKKTLLEHTLTELLDTSPGEVHLVLGAHHEQIQQQLNFEKNYPRVHVLYNPNWINGIASSIACAAKKISMGSYKGLMLTLADQVAISAAHLKDLRELWYQNADKIVCSLYAGTKGAPAIFPHSQLKQLCALEGDEGAKKVINQYQHIQFELAEAKIDIDTERQLNDWQLDML